MKTKLMTLALLAGSSMFAQSRFSIGVQVGGYDQGYSEPTPVYSSQIPPCPGPDYGWTEGYWQQDYGRRVWIAGFWARQRFHGPRLGYGFVDNRDFGRRGGDDRPGFYAGRRDNYGRGFEINRSGGEDRGRNQGRDSGRDEIRSGNGFRGR